MASEEEDWVPAQAPDERSYLQRLQDYTPYAAGRALRRDPVGTIQRAAQTGEDAIRAAINPFGMADRFAGKMESLVTGKSYDEEVAKQFKLSEEARERSPVASTVGDVAQAAALPGLGAEALAARWGGTLGARALAHAIPGAAYGAAEGAGSTHTGTASDYGWNAAKGAGVGFITGGAGGAAFGRRPPVSAAQTPVQADLFAAKARDYAGLEASNIPYNAAPLARRANQLEADLFRTRDPIDLQTTRHMLNRMREPVVVTPSYLETIRQQANNIPPARTTDIEAAGRVRDVVDDFIANPPRSAIVPGTERQAQLAAAVAERARGNYGAMKRVEAMNDMLVNARNAAGSANSGLNFENVMRGQVKNFIRQNDGKSQATRHGFIPREIQQLSNFDRFGNIEGRRAQNLLRYGANLGGGGGGLGALVTGLAGAGGAYQFEDPKLAWALALPAAGLGMRVAGNRMADRNIQRLTDMVAQRSPLYQQRAAVAGMRPGPGNPAAADTARNVITNRLMDLIAGSPEEEKRRPSKGGEWE